MKLLFVVNPISGGVNKKPFINKAKQICEKYGHKYFEFNTSGEKSDNKKLKTLVDKIKPDKVISVGGDGTTLFTSLVLLGTNYPIGIIPMGSANGMAAELYVKSNPVEALKDIIMSDLYAGLDIVRVNNKYHSIHIGDVGVNAQVVYNYEKDPKRGMITYAKYFFEQLSKLEAFNVKIKTKEQEINSKTYMAAICNARKFGTGIPLNLTGNPMDGKFEIVLINKIDVKSLIKIGLQGFRDNFQENQTGSVISTDYAEIEFDTERLLQLDGEVIGRFKNIKIEILKSAINFITTTDNLYIKSDKI